MRKNNLLVCIKIGITYDSHFRSTLTCYPLPFFFLLLFDVCNKLKYKKAIKQYFKVIFKFLLNMDLSQHLTDP